MEIRVYFQPLIKWWKLILFACLLAGISAFLLVRRQPPIYQTQTTLVIGRAVYEANPSFGEIGITTQLATYYSNIALREVVRTSTMEALGLNYLYVPFIVHDLQKAVEGMDYFCKRYFHADDKAEAPILRRDQRADVKQGRHNGK